MPGFHSRKSLNRYTSKSSYYAQRLIKGPCRDSRELDPVTGRYIPYSPRTRKALEAIGDIKMMIARKREARSKLYTDKN